MSHFRETLVAMQIAGYRRARLHEFEQAEMATIVGNATRLALQCCEQWGHPWNDREPNGKPAKGATCTRCGGKPAS